VLLTGTDIQQWLGAEAMDPFGQPLGRIAEVLRDQHSGAPEWLLLAEPDAPQGHPVPVAGAVPSGQRIRVVATADRVAGAPLVPVGEDFDPQLKSRVASHYELRLDTDASPTGLLQERPDHIRPAASDPPRIAPERLRALIAGLREAHAMEQASLKLLAAMRWRARDEELVHDLALHHKATNDHAERIRVRLDQLDANRGRPLDWIAKLGAYLEAQRGRARQVPEPADLLEACRFEQAEVAAYDRLLETARQAGDRLTAVLCDANRADEMAMLATLEGHRLHADPGARRGRESPFQAPPELAESAPRS
jgi:ferritin-like metal-binding protein YciE